VNPRVTVVLPAMLGYGTVRAALDSWERQMRRDAIEILVLDPDAAASDGGDWRRQPIRLPIGSMLLHEARAYGVRQARAPFVVIAEDHCLPEPDWVERLLPLLDGGWMALGPALVPGNRETRCAEASFLLGYGQWMMPVASGSAEALPGHNTVVRRETLVEMGPALEAELMIGSFLMQRLRQEGGTMTLNRDMRMRHFDLPEWVPSLKIFWNVGLGFGARRSHRWSLPRRALYAALAPAIAAAHWRRAFRHFRRAGRAAGLSPATLLAAVPLAAAWGCGEAWGALAGLEWAKYRMWLSEVKPVTPELASRAASASP
jgi:hypothetical protein